MNKITRINLKVRLGDVVSVNHCRDVKIGKRINVLPINDIMEGATRDLFHDCLKYVSRPVRKGDHFLVKRGTINIKFRVTETNPVVYGVVVNPYTQIFCDSEPIKRDSVTDMHGFSGLPIRLPQLSKDIKALKLDGLSFHRSQLFEYIEPRPRIGSEKPASSFFCADSTIMDPTI